MPGSSPWWSVLLLVACAPDAASKPPADAAGLDAPQAADSAPVDSAPVDSAPVDSAPVDSAPVDSAPADSAPVDSVPADAGGPITDSGIVCHDDSLFEPNEDLATATPTALGPADLIGFNDMALCPGADIDVYRGTFDAGVTIDATIDFDASVALLRLEIVDSAGTVIAVGTPDGPNRRNASATTAASGDYYLRVSSELGAANNYDMVASSS